MPLVPVDNDTPKQLVSSSPYATEQVHTDFDGVLKHVAERIGPVGDLNEYGCLRPGQWISDHVMYEFIQFLNHGMPMSDTGLQEDLFGRNDFQQGKGKRARQIDFGEVCILDPQVAKTILLAHTDQDYSKILRIFKASCNFHLLKRVLLPLNVAWNDTIAPDGLGCHWMLAEFHLDRNHVHIFDWNSTPETKPLVGYGKLSGPLFSLPCQVHERCDGLCTTTPHDKYPHLKLHQRNVQKNGYDCGVWTLCVMYFRALKCQHNTDPATLFETMDLKNPRDATLLRLYLYMKLPVFDSKHLSPQLQCATTALECVRVSFAVGNPEAMGALGLVGVVSCVRVGNFDEADMVHVHMRPAGNGHHSHCLFIVQY